MKRTVAGILAASIAVLAIPTFTSCETTSVRKLGPDKRPIAQKLRNSTNLRGY